MEARQRPVIRRDIHVRIMIMVYCKYNRPEAQV